MDPVLAWAGPALVAIAWQPVRLRRVSVWVAMGATLGVLGTLSVLTGLVRACTIDTGLALGAGSGAGLALYGATAVFLRVVGRWPALRRHAQALYDQRRGVPLWLALALALLLVVPGEELLFRGVVLRTAAGALGQAGGAVVAWGAYLASQVASLSVPVILGGIVGGLAWTALAVWSGGVLAGLACHAVWTALMIARPLLPDRS